MSDFLRRWSQRKRASLAETAAESDAKPLAAETSGGQGPQSSPSEPAIAGPDSAELAEKLAALPDIESIGPKTDIRPFLQDFVPAALRKAALRRAWLSDPIISTHLDVARDYAWEFNTGPGPVGFYRGLARESVARGMAALEGSQPQPQTLPAAQALPGESYPDQAGADLAGGAGNSAACDRSAPVSQPQTTGRGCAASEGPAPDLGEKTAPDPAADLAGQPQAPPTEGPGARLQRLAKRPPRHGGALAD